MAAVCRSFHLAILATLPSVKVASTELVHLTAAARKLPVIRRLIVFTGGRGTGPHRFNLSSDSLRQLAVFWNMRELHLRLSPFQQGASPAEQLPAVLSALSSLPNLAVLNLSGLPDLGQPTVAALAGLTQLRGLGLGLQQGQRPPVVPLTGLTCITSLSVFQSKQYMLQGGAAAIGEVTTLRELDVHDCCLNSLPGTDWPWDYVFDRLLGRLCVLTKLVMYRNPGVRDEAISAVARLPCLRVLDVHDCQIGDNEVEILVWRSQLTWLDISKTKSRDVNVACPAHLAVSSVGARTIAQRLPNLECLRINGNPIGVAGVMAFTALTRLTELSARSYLVPKAGGRRGQAILDVWAPVWDRFRAHPSYKLDLAWQ